TGDDPSRTPSAPTWTLAVSVIDSRGAGPPVVSISTKARPSGARRGTGGKAGPRMKIAQFDRRRAARFPPWARPLTWGMGAAAGAVGREPAAPVRLYVPPPTKGCRRNADRRRAVSPHAA